MTPPQVPGYEFVREIPRGEGEGGQATVFVYRDLTLGRLVAVKVLREQGANVDAVLAEARAMAAVDHAHLVPIHNVVRAVDGQPCIVMMYCDNGNMLTKVRDKDAPGGRPRYLSLRKVVRLGIQIAGVVHAVHERGIVHRDIKPANILLDATDSPRLTDFGIAGRLGSADGQGQLSLLWCPPEILDGGQATVASDVFSLGATLWHLLAGRSPFDVPGRRSRQEVEARVRNPRPPHTGRRDTPQELEGLLTRMMAQRPSDRPRSALQVVEELTAIEQRYGGPRSGEQWHTNEVRETVAPVRAADEATRLRPSGVPSAPPSYATPVPAYDVPGLAAGVTGVKPRPSTLAPAPMVEAPQPAGGRRWVPATVAAAVLALVTVGLVIARPWDRPPPAQTTVDSDDDVETVLPPGRPTVVGTREGETLRFEWNYSAPLDSDTYQWRVTGTSQVGTATEPSVEVTSPVGTEVCIEVKVVRFDGSYASLEWSEPGCVQ